MAKFRKVAPRDRQVTELSSKLRNLKFKRDRCIEPMGIKRLSGLIRDTQRQLDSMTKP